MAANLLLLKVNQGATLRRSFRLQDENGHNLDLTGASARLQFRRTLRSSVVLLEANVENGRLVLDEGNGQITLILSAEETAIFDQSCPFGLEVTFAGNLDQRNYQGFLRVNPTVVR